MDQAEQAVPSVEDRIAASLNLVEEEKAPEQAPQEQATQEQTDDAPAEPAVEGADAEEVAEDTLTPEQLQHYKVKVKIDGEEKDVSLEEARLGYMRLEDYTRKTQEISKQKNEVPDLVKKEVAEKAQKYDHNVKVFYQALVQLADQELATTDWNKLANDDPAEFVKKTHRRQQFENYLRTAEGEIKKANEEREVEKKQAVAQAIEQAKETLPKVIPNWSNDLYNKVLKSGVDAYEFTPEEVSEVVDHRMIRVLHDAMQWRNLKDSKTLVDKKVADVPKVLKPGTQQSKALVNAEKDKELRDRLRKSGSVDDATALILQRMTRR